MKIENIRKAIESSLSILQAPEIPTSTKVENTVPFLQDALKEILEHQLKEKERVSRYRGTERTTTIVTHKHDLDMATMKCSHCGKSVQDLFAEHEKEHVVTKEEREAVYVKVDAEEEPVITHEELAREAEIFLEPDAEPVDDLEPEVHVPAPSGEAVDDLDIDLDEPVPAPKPAEPDDFILLDD